MLLHIHFEHQEVVDLEKCQILTKVLLHFRNALHKYHEIAESTYLMHNHEQWAPFGCREIMHEVTQSRTSWGPQETDVWYIIGLARDHYQCNTAMNIMDTRKYFFAKASYSAKFYLRGNWKDSFPFEINISPHLLLSIDNFHSCLHWMSQLGMPLIYNPPIKCIEDTSLTFPWKSQCITTLLNHPI